MKHSPIYNKHLADLDDQLWAIVMSQIGNAAWQECCKIFGKWNNRSRHCL